MYVYWEISNSARSDCDIKSLSWTGAIPDYVADYTYNKTYTLCRRTYYREGWLATGNANNIVGVTYTGCHPQDKEYPIPTRSNFNLRGHRNEVCMVHWNERFHKLATCDVMGVIFVWIKHEGRWSIELINDRNTKVTDFSWSHDGEMALVCYCDGFVLVGSVSGQRYWSSLLDLEGCVISCGAWTPNDDKVMLGTSDGQLVVLSSRGVILNQTTLVPGVEVTGMAWPGEKFKFTEEMNSTTTSTTSPAGRKDSDVGEQVDTADEKTADEKCEKSSSRGGLSVDSGIRVDSMSSLNSNTSTVEEASVVAISFKSGDIHFMRNCLDVSPRIVQTGLTKVRMDWSNSKQILAVTGYIVKDNKQYHNKLLFYNHNGDLLYTSDLPIQEKPVTSLVWAHNDRRIFLSVGCHICTAWISKSVATLQFLCKHRVQTVVSQPCQLNSLGLPIKLKDAVELLYTSTVKGYIPDPYQLREFVCYPALNNERLFCTMKRSGNDDTSSNTHYTLYLEYLGGLIPLLKGKRASKLRPEFVIFDPKLKTSNKNEIDDIMVTSDSSDSDSDEDELIVDGCGSPRLQRRKKVKSTPTDRDENHRHTNVYEQMYDSNLPEKQRLVEVTSNLWGTKFKIHGLAPFLPEDLGHILYKTSLLHLQPRQMTIGVMEMNPDNHFCFDNLEQNYNSHQFSESEDEGSRYDDNSLPKPQAEIVISPEQSHMPFCYDRSSTLELNLQTPPQGSKEPLTPMRDAIVSPSESFIRDFSQTAESALKSPGLLLVDDPDEIDTTVVNTCKDTPMKHDNNDMRMSLNNAPAKVLHPAQKTSPCNVNNVESSYDVVELVAQRLQEELQHQDRSTDKIKYIDDEDELLTAADLKNKENIVPDLSTQYILNNSNVTKNNLGTQDTRIIKSTNSSPTKSYKSSALRSRPPMSSPLTITKALRCRRGSVELGCVNPIAPLAAETVHSTSLPSSPIRKLLPQLKRAKSKQEVSHRKLWLPKLRRHCLKTFKTVESSDEESVSASAPMGTLQTGENYRNLESFQKAQLSKKIRKAKDRPNSFYTVPVSASSSAPPSPKPKHLMMHNKAPLWNENSQVYQLDFGGRVTQESAKNFQIEYSEDQVMQFGRIDGNAYTLDFQYPFSAVQAFSVALANITQRLK